MAKAPGILGGKALTDELRKLAMQVHTVLDDGTPVTRAQTLAELIWKLALGWVETTRDDDGNRKEIAHPPVAWAMQYVFERTEGKAAIAQSESVDRISATDKVRDLAKARINKLAAVTVGPPKIPRPPAKDSNEQA